MRSGSLSRRGVIERTVRVLLLTGVVMPSPSAAAAAAATTAVQPQSAEPDIVITAPPLFRDVQPERNLDEGAISSYGLSTVEELLGEVQAELGEDEEPLILVNGERVDDLDQIGALPIEALHAV